jgi:hypothetical protein
MSPRWGDRDPHSGNVGLSMPPVNPMTQQVNDQEAI